MTSVRPVLKYHECNPHRENYSFPIPIHSTKNVQLDGPSTRKQQRQMSNHIRQQHIKSSTQPPCFSEVNISSVASYDSAQTHLSNMSWKTSVPPQLMDPPVDMVTTSVSPS
ncbi:unnamed protein product [Rhizophagus irregularis]|nr:unnamed protein product [Rhizophagus irregularis]